MSSYKIKPNFTAEHLVGNFGYRITRYNDVYTVFYFSYGIDLEYGIYDNINDALNEADKILSVVKNKL